jgi:hypothetical protein
MEPPVKTGTHFLGATFLFLTIASHVDSRPSKCRRRLVRRVESMAKVKDQAMDGRAMPRFPSCRQLLPPSPWPN